MTADHACLIGPLQGDAFADDSVRLIKTIRKKNPGVGNSAL